MLGPGYLDAWPIDMVFLSPGVNPERGDYPRSDAGVTFSSEIELVPELSSAPVIGITGSSGRLLRLLW